MVNITLLCNVLLFWPKIKTEFFLREGYKSYYILGILVEKYIYDRRVMIDNI